MVRRRTCSTASPASQIAFSKTSGQTDRAASLGPDNIERLKEDLASIESRRQALTEAGILVETAEPLVPPEGKFLPAVAAALEIFAADSKAKLSTFDAIYPKVSVFRDLLAKKLKPKTLQINRENGAEVFRGDIPVKLEGLSSGEKHEFIMLFRLIFETPENALVLIDEPEISLHVLWQLEFMSDLRRIQSANKFQSIIATHSPQIIQGSEDIIIDLSEQNK
jgi:predicted ATPase